MLPHYNKIDTCSWRIYVFHFGSASFLSCAGLTYAFLRCKLGALLSARDGHLPMQPMQLHQAPPLWGTSTMVSGQIIHFCQMQLSLENSVETPLSTKNFSSELADFVSNVSKRAQLSCSCCTVYLPSITILTRLTEDDDVIKSLLREAQCQALALSPASRSCIGPCICYGRDCNVHIQKMKHQRVAARFRDIDRMGSVFMTLL